jgi:hypothetical protein
MPISKRRGRPAGTDYREDSEALTQVADHMVADQSLKPSSAMWTVCKARKWKGKTDEAIVARWLRKWKTQGAAQLESAYQRRAAQGTRPIAVGHVEFANPTGFAEFGARIKHLQAEMAAAAEPMRKAMERFAVDINTPGMRTFLEEQKKIAEALAASPAIKELQRISTQMRNLPPIPDRIYMPQVTKRFRDG